MSSIPIQDTHSQRDVVSALQQDAAAQTDDVSHRITVMMRRARKAQQAFVAMGRQAMDDAVCAAGWAIMQPDRNRELAQCAVRDTGLGNVADKIVKNHRKTLGLLRDLQGVVAHGVMTRDAASGITEIARPVGVVAAITPSTNPAATPANKMINALKCGNAIILAPSPKGVSSSQLLLRFVHEQFDKCGLPSDLVQALEPPINKALTAELMRQADLVVATGSQSNVRMAYGSGTPAFGVGAGNVASIVDDTADLSAAAENIWRSKTFDNATSCSSENSVIILDAVYAQMLTALQACGGVLLTAQEKDRLRQVMWPQGRLSAAVTGKDADEILRVADMEDIHARTAGACSMLLVEETGFGTGHPFSGEKLSPVLTVYRARDFDHAMEIVEHVYAFMGAGHSVSLHSTAPDRALKLGLRLPVARVIVNQAHCFATGGNFDNGLPFSLSMGCGTWGGNNFSGNMNYRHYMNVTRIAERIAPREPTPDALFDDYWKRYGA